MSGYYLCRTPRARRPFEIESIGISIYSMEELCYYLSENVYLIDETIINHRLCVWIGEELGLTRLSKILTRSLEKGEDLTTFIMPIFKECGYLREEKLRYFREQLQDIQIEPQDTRRKMKADYLTGYGMYVSAIAEYEKILERRSPGRLGVQFYASVLESMAGAYARMFRFEEAAQCLWQSYQVLKSRKVYEKYLRLLPLFLPERAYLERLSEIKADRTEAHRLKDETEAMMLEGQETEEALEWKREEPKKMIEKLKKEYLKIS